MNRQEARLMLGVTADALTEEIQSVWARQTEALAVRMIEAPSMAQRQALELESKNLDRALDVLLGPGTAASMMRPPGFVDVPGTTLAPGTMLRGRYRIVRVLARGGMGAVYEAEDCGGLEESGRIGNHPRVALKVLLPELSADPRARERFWQEGRIARDLSHDGCVRVYDVDRDGSLCFLTMELLQGRTLKALMDAHRFSVAEVVDLAEQVGEALAYAHGKGVVHRDVKPQNIWVTECADGRRKYKLLDFGLAKVMTSSGFTQMAEQLGTAIYVAPEQREGKIVDHRADQYSLGVVLYELLTGMQPTGNVKPVHLQVSGISATMSDAIHRAMEGTPEQRYSSIREMLDLIRAGAVIFRSASRNVRNKLVLSVAGVLVLLQMLALGVGAYSLSRMIQLPVLIDIDPSLGAALIPEIARAASIGRWLLVVILVLNTGIVVWLVWYMAGRSQQQDQQ